MPDTKEPKLDYAAAGVNYDVLDGFKRYCQQAAATTTPALSRHGFSEPQAIRGESCYLIETPNEYLAHVEEALGTKVMVADAMFKLTGKSYYGNVAIDDVSTIVNDLCASGALPVTVAMYAAVGDDVFFSDQTRSRDLAQGFAEGCRLSGAAWSGGETQTLKGMISSGTCVLGGSAFGRIHPKSNRVLNQVKSGDAIVFLASSGVQTNGLTLCRALADRMPSGYLTKLPSGRSYGEALLDPSVIYVKFMEACQKAGLSLHYTAHMTGHGWRKLMRLDAPFVYRIDFVPPAPEVFGLIAKESGLDQKEMYETFNMGVGWAAYVAEEDAQRCVDIARGAGYTAWRAGSVTEALDPATGMPAKGVEVPSLGIRWTESDLHIR
jgi:phosphoribosylformylglycinamidine cyclo-ligase